MVKHNIDLLKKYFCEKYNYGVYVKTSHSNGLNANLKAREQGSDNNLATFGKVEYKSGEFTFGGTLTSANDFKLNLQYVPQDYKDYTLKSELTSKFGQSKSASKNVAIEYKTQNVAAGLKVVDTPTVNLNAVFGTTKLGAGFDATFKVSDGRFSTYNFGAYYHEDNHKFALLHKSTSATEYAPGNLVLSGYKKLNDELQAGFNATYGVSNGDLKAEVGGQYKLDSRSSVRAKFDLNANLALGFKKDFSSTVSLMAGVSADLRKVSNDLDAAKIGFKVKLSPKD